MADMKTAATLQFREDFRRIAEGEIMEHHYMLLFVNQGLACFLDDQRCRKQQLFLQTQMGMHPVGSRAPVLEAIFRRLARFERRSR